MYEEFAGIYDQLMAEVDYDRWAARLCALMQEAGAAPGARCVECACGTGSLTWRLARAGYRMTGVDLSGDMLRCAMEKCRDQGMTIPFVRQDMRALKVPRRVSAVLCTCDGVNYLLSAEEVRAFFRAAREALKPGGRHFMDVMNGDYADCHFPCQLWEAGEKCLTLSRFEWNRETRTLLYGQLDYAYGSPLPKPERTDGNSIRLYTLAEIREIFAVLGLQPAAAYADFSGKPASKNDIQLMILSEKTK